MDYSQVGRAGELALTLAALVTSDGQVELFAPVVDDDHVDLVASVRGGLPALAIQVKTAAHLDAAGEVEARASYPAGEVREHPRFVYAVLLLEGVEIGACWLVPSPDFNRLAYRQVSAGRETLEFRAAPGSHPEFAVEARQIGLTLLRLASRAGAAPEWLLALKTP